MTTRTGLLRVSACVLALLLPACEASLVDGGHDLPHSTGVTSGTGSTDTTTTTDAADPCVVLSGGSACGADVPVCPVGRLRCTQITETLSNCPMDAGCALMCGACCDVTDTLTQVCMA